MEGSVYVFVFVFVYVLFLCLCVCVFVYFCVGLKKKNITLCVQLWYMSTSSLPRSALGVPLYPTAAANPRERHARLAARSGACVAGLSWADALGVVVASVSTVFLNGLSAERLRDPLLGGAHRTSLGPGVVVGWAGVFMLNPFLA